MRQRFECQTDLGQTPIAQVVIPLKSRDELPPVLAGLQWIFCTPAVNHAVFDLLEKKVLGGKQAHTGRPGMDLWHILVLGVVRLCLDCDYARKAPWKSRLRRGQTGQKRGCSSSLRRGAPRKL